MTDNEIVKAFKYWKQFDKDIDTLRESHPQYADMWDEQKEIMKITWEVFDSFNRQKAEIERLKFNLKAVLDERADHTEAYKEFAEVVKKHQVMLFNEIYSSKGFAKAIDNLLNELVGEDDE